MKFTVSLLLICLFSSINLVSAQEADSTEVYKIADPVSMGFGMGQDYGGIGANVLVYPQENFGLFGGVGYAYAGMGYNVGAKVRFFSEKNPRTNFFITGMYGYNAAVAVKGASDYNKFFYGPTIGFGIDTGKRSYKKGYWTMALLIPFRESAVKDYMDYLEDENGVEFKGALLPFTFSIGYRFALD